MWLVHWKGQGLVITHVLSIFCPSSNWNYAFFILHDGLKFTNKSYFLDLQDKIKDLCEWKLQSRNRNAVLSPTLISISFLFQTAAISVQFGIIPLCGWLLLMNRTRIFHLSARGRAPSKMTLLTGCFPLRIRPIESCRWVHSIMIQQEENGLLPSKTIFSSSVKCWI